MSYGTDKCLTIQKWSDSAMNSTYRAVASTFNTSRFPKLRSISFVSEPEACAHFTLRAAQNKDRGRLKRVSIINLGYAISKDES